MPLDDQVVVYPAHGAGSACGKNMMKETVDTLGNQKKMNYALRADMTREEFIQEVTDGLLPPPAYFPLNVKMNKQGYDSIDDVYEKGLNALSPDDFEQMAEATGAVVLDVRPESQFVKGFIPQSIFIGLDGGFAPWVGALLQDTQQPLLLVAPKDREKEAITRLARVGFDNVLGFLNGGIAAWQDAEKEIDSLESHIVAQVEQKQAESPIAIVDVRKKNEFLSEHVKEALNIPLDDINSSMAEFPQNEDFYLHCAGGYRSVIAASILKSRGYHNIINIEGGFEALKDSDLKTTDYVCPSTL